MALGYLTALRNAQLDAISTAVGSGGRIRIYSGVRPATGGAVTTLLGEFTFAGAFAPAATGGVLTPNTPPATTGITAGTATWYRIVTSANAFVMDGDAGTSGTDMILSTTTISSGLPLSITGHTITAGNA